MIDGLHNFRDVGSLPVKGGAVTRARVLYRSEALATLTDRGRDQFAATPISTVVDFRTPAERTSAPNRLPAQRSYSAVELSILEGAMADLAKRMMSSEGPADPAVLEQAMASLPTLDELYLTMVRHGAEHFARVARLVAAGTGDNDAVLIHCTAGKDRTGVAVALVLEAVGVERDAVVADYAQSEHNLAGAWADAMLQAIAALGVPLTPELRTLATATPPEVMVSLLTWLDEQHGGAAAYLASGGFGDDELGQLRERLVG